MEPEPVEREERDAERAADGDKDQKPPRPAKAAADGSDSEGEEVSKPSKKRPGVGLARQQDLFLLLTLPNHNICPFSDVLGRRR